jgi:hypothetical protein
MNKCWASGLDKCNGKLTGEHLVSNNLLGSKIKVKGFKWRKDEMKEIGSAGFVSNFLCKKHNEALSLCDEEIKKLNSAFDSWARNAKRFSLQSFSLKEITITYKINGNLLERWFVKTPDIKQLRQGWKHCLSPTWHVC